MIPIIDIMKSRYRGQPPSMVRDLLINQAIDNARESTQNTYVTQNLKNYHTNGKLCTEQLLVTGNGRTPRKKITIKQQRFRNNQVILRKPLQYLGLE